MVRPVVQWSAVSNGRSNDPMAGRRHGVHLGMYWGLLLPCLCEGLGPPPLIPATPPILRPPQPPSPHSRDPSNFAAAASLRAFREPLRFCVPRLPARILGPGRDQKHAMRPGRLCAQHKCPRPKYIWPQRLCAHPECPCSFMAPAALRAFLRSLLVLRPQRACVHGLRPRVSLASMFPQLF